MGGKSLETSCMVCLRVKKIYIYLKAGFKETFYYLTQYKEMCKDAFGVQGNRIHTFMYVWKCISSRMGRTLTNSNIGGAVSLQELVQMLPDLGNPINNFNQLCISHPATDLCFNQFSPQETAEKAFDWLSVVSTQHPSEAEQQKCLQYKKKYSGLNISYHF